jgi:hypothetical protein
LEPIENEEKNRETRALLRKLRKQRHRDRMAARTELARAPARTAAAAPSPPRALLPMALPSAWTTREARVALMRLSPGGRLRVLAEGLPAVLLPIARQLGHAQEDFARRRVPDGRPVGDPVEFRYEVLLATIAKAVGDNHQRVRRAQKRVREGHGRIQLVVYEAQTDVLLEVFEAAFALYKQRQDIARWQASEGRVHPFAATLDDPELGLAHLLRAARQRIDSRACRLDGAPNTGLKGLPA